MTKWANKIRHILTGQSDDHPDPIMNIILCGLMLFCIAGLMLLLTNVDEDHFFATWDSLIFAYNISYILGILFNSVLGFLYMRYVQFEEPITIDYGMEDYYQDQHNKNVTKYIIFVLLGWGFANLAIPAVVLLTAITEGIKYVINNTYNGIVSGVKNTYKKINIHQ